MKDLLKLSKATRKRLRKMRAEIEREEMRKRLWLLRNFDKVKFEWTVCTHPE